ncbi:hypothetical protein vBAcoSR7M_1 [Alteromonas phage vB_AcoS-R7M]|uniref:Uncharacterized protein n=1 Tax=Alteromonas phage vB_AcoS-R7M TaxID=2729541 RepID=A0A6M3YN26_9CAUD|nr:hypothetical protein HWD34_gp01 [Alteromonas phage vB_AcoS-R7M]QJI53323.1 hypothetical protein vBAcoSR7M_1 [Alteromonas phage vB_AcoS-R7M]
METFNTDNTRNALDHACGNVAIALVQLAELYNANNKAEGLEEANLEVVVEKYFEEVEGEILEMAKHLIATK